MKRKINFMFEENQKTLEKFSKFYEGWGGQYGKVGLTKESYYLGLKEGEQVPEMHDDGFIISSSGNKVNVAKLVRRDDRIFLSAQDNVYGPFGFYVEVKNHRLNVFHNNKKFQKTTVATLMYMFKMSDNDVLKWTHRNLDNVLERAKGALSKQDAEKNIRVIKDVKTSEILTKKWGGEHVTIEVSRFICFCLERLTNYLDDQDHIKNKIIYHKFFFLDNDMSADKRKNILATFSKKIDSMSDKHYYNVSERNQIDIWSSARKIILNDKDHANFSIRTLHYSYSKYFCPFETPHDKHAGLHTSLSCLTVIAPPWTPPNIDEISSILSNTGTPLFYDGYYFGKTKWSVVDILEKMKSMNKYASVYSISHPSTLAGIYISNYAGRIMRYAMLSFDEGMFICAHMEECKELRKVLDKEITHPSLYLGLAASLIPLLEHNAGPRGVFMTNMIKQTLDASGRNKIWKKADKALIVTITTEALGRTFSGLNLLVKWAIDGGFNVEDGITATHRLSNILAGEIKQKFSMSLSKGEYILDKVEEGSTVERNDFLASKITFGDNVTTEFLRASVDRKSTVRSVKVKSNRIEIVTSYSFGIKVGDKMVSQAAQKGVVSRIKADDCDIIINPCSIPSRMTLGQIYEGIISNYMMKNNIDQPYYFPAFEKNVHLFMQSIGFQSIDDAIPKQGAWTCYNRYFLLGQRTDEKTRHRGQGDEWNTNKRTNQPVRGRKNEGGLRVGIMEKDVLLSHGAHKIINTLFFDHSDGINVFLCQSCKQYTPISTCATCNVEAQAIKINKSQINFENKIRSMGLSID